MPKLPHPHPHPQPPLPPPPDTLRLRAAGVHLHVQRAGQGSPLLLLHGFPDDADLWQPLVPLLSPRHRLWMPDQRGYRHSDKPVLPGDYTIDVLLADVLALADHMHGGAPGRIALAGHDWGGMLAWAFAARYPQRVERLVIFNAPHPCRFAELLRSDAQQRAASAYVQTLCQPGQAALLAADGHARLRTLMSRAVPGMCDEDIDALARGWATPGALPAMLNWYCGLDFNAAVEGAGVPALPGLGGASGHIEAPTLLLWGDQDGSFVPANLQGLDRWVPRLQVRRFAQGGHWLLREQPAEVATAMVQFLSA